LFSEVSTNRVVVLSSGLECLQSKFASQELSNIALALRQRFKEFLVICRVRKYRNTGMVFRCCAKEGYASDVYFLNGISEGAFRLRDG
jgi:hypothetical protein